MALTNYQKAYSAFTGLIAPYTRPNSDRLKKEIQDSAIVTALDHIDTDDGTQVCDIWFKDVLDSGDETILDGIVANHTGEPLAPSLPIQPVKDIDVCDLDPEYALTKVVGVSFDASIGAWTKKDVSWPYHVNVLNGEGYAGFAESGDKTEFRLVPVAVGGVAALASAGSSQVVVDDGIKGLFAGKTIFPGMVFKFRRDGDSQQYPDNPDPGSDEYEIESFDPGTNTVTLRTSLESDVPAASIVFLVVKYGEMIELQQGEAVNVGGAAAGSAPVQANQIFEMWYYAMSDKRVRFRLNLKYGPLKEE